MHPHLSLPLQRTPPFMQRAALPMQQSARGAGRRHGVNRGTERRTLRLPAAAASDLNINAAGCARASGELHSTFALFLVLLVTSMSGPWTARTARKKGLKILARTLRAQLIATARIVSFGSDKCARCLQPIMQAPPPQTHNADDARFFAFFCCWL